MERMSTAAGHVIALQRRARLSRYGYETINIGLFLAAANTWRGLLRASLLARTRPVRDDQDPSSDLLQNVTTLARRLYRISTDPKPRDAKHLILLFL